MRRQLVLVFGAVSLMVALAFVIPLAVLVRSTAEDRAMDTARADAAALVPALVIDGTQEQLELAASATEAGRAGTLTVRTSDGLRIGSDDVSSERFEAALTSGASAIGSVEGGREVVTAVATGDGELSAIRVFVPDERLREGQNAAWLALGVVALILVGLSVVVADRLAASIVRPTEQLALGARRLGGGELDARVEPDGPPELVELAGAFNRLGDQVSSMLARERELVAELSHRLRTPLTKLRMRIEQVPDPALAGELQADVGDLTQVVNDLIAEARTSLSSSTEVSDAAAVVTERVAFWSVLAEDQNRTASFAPAPGPLWVPVAQAALSAAIDVLIENVFAHTEEDVSFSVGFSSNDRQVRIWVADDGAGFEAGAAGRGVSGVGSTGLGLDIARSTAQSAGGSVEFGQTASGGTEVTMVLPLAAGPT